MRLLLNPPSIDLPVSISSMRAPQIALSSLLVAVATWWAASVLYQPTTSPSSLRQTAFNKPHDRGKPPVRFVEYKRLDYGRDDVICVVPPANKGLWSPKQRIVFWAEDALLPCRVFTADVQTMGGERVVFWNLLKNFVDLNYEVITIQSYHRDALADTLTRIASSSAAMPFVVGNGYAMEPAWFPSWYPSCRMMAFAYWPVIKSFMDPSRYLTAVPDSPANTFLGYVTEECPASTEDVPPKAVIAATDFVGVLWGKSCEYYDPAYMKQDLMWPAETYAKLFGRVPTLKLFAFVKEENCDKLPASVVNLGSVPRRQFFAVLSKAHFFLGQGHPRDGPSAFDAVACGATYINPITRSVMKPWENVHHRRLHLNRSDVEEVMRISSQHIPSEYFGPPHVYHVYNETDLFNAIDEIRKRPPGRQRWIPPPMRRSEYVERIKKIFNDDNC
jgi:hypothetical protein